MLPDDATPHVDCLIALTMAEHPGTGRTEQAEFYEAVHMELAPLARQLEREARRWRRKLHQLRLDVLAVMPENWLEDPDWVALAENQKFDKKVGDGDTAKNRGPLTSAQIRALEVETASCVLHNHPTDAEAFARAVERAHGIV